jgi:hypothetical protein
MQKRSRIRPSLDVNQLAYAVVAEATEPNHEDVSRFMRAMGSKGGKIGGKKRWDGVSPEEKSRILSAAARKRWSGKETAKD